MILAWISSLPAVFVATAIVLIPGALMLRGLLRLRGFCLVAFSPVASVAMVSVAAVVLAILSVRWSPLSLAAALLVMVLVGWGLGRYLRQPASPETSGGARWVLPLGVAVGAILGAWRLVAYIQDPAGISQTNDSVFHLNAIRYILDTADASSLHVSSVIGGSGFYPAAWHAIVSMTVMITGSEIPVVANALTMVIGAMIWPLGIAALARVVTGSARIAAVTAVLSPALQMFPLMMFQWGVLFPNALSVAMVPAASAMVMMLPRWHDPGHRITSWTRVVLLLGVVVAALALAQPAALPVWGLICVIWFSDWMLRVQRTPALKLRMVAVAAAWVALVAAWLVLSRGTGGSHWPPYRGKLDAVLDVLLNGQMLVPFAWGISVLMIAGLVTVALTAEWRWFGVVWFGVSVLYILVAAIGMPLVRTVVLGPWYADPYRLAAFAPIAVLPLAAIGLDRLIGLVAARRGMTDGPIRNGASILISAVGVLLIVLLRLVPMPAFLQGTFDKDSRYLTTSESYLSVDERWLLESLGRYVEPGSRVIGNPSTGSGFGYMLSGVDVFPRTWSPPASSAWDVVAGGLRDVVADPAVCNALHELGDPHYVLDFGPGEDGPGRFLVPGMTDFAGQAGFELIAERGDASLWQITACAR